MRGMDRLGRSSIRVGTAEREETVAVLNAHRAAGRLTGEEYEDRSVRAAAARTRGDLDALFADLPLPHAVHGVPATEWSPTGVAEPAGRSWWPTVVRLSPFLALASFFVFRNWVVFLLVPVIYMVANGRGHRRSR